MMKKVTFLLCFVSLMTNAQSQSKPKTLKGYSYEKIAPIFNRNAADASPLVHDGKLYVLSTVDGRAESQSWQISSTKDMVNWTENKKVLSISDFKWLDPVSYAWAAELVEQKGKFYIYATIANQSQRLITVAVADKIEGPYKDAKGAPLITSRYYNGYARPNLDPAVYIDNGTPYLFWDEFNENGKQCNYAKLDESMIYLEEGTSKVDLSNYMFSPWVHKYKDWYYLSYAEGNPTLTGYARSKSIDGPWEYMGAIHNRLEGVFSNQQAIVEFKKQWYLIFHAGRNDNHRRIYAVPMEYDKDDEIIPFD